MLQAEVEEQAQDVSPTNDELQRDDALLTNDELERVDAFPSGLQTEEQGNGKYKNEESEYVCGSCSPTVQTERWKTCDRTGKIE